MVDINLYNGDCLEVMDKLISEGVKVDLVVTSPPYDNLREYGKSSTWNFDIFKDIAKELCRVIKDGGVLVWVVGDQTVKGSETGTSFKQALYFKELGLNLHDTMIYAKNNPIPQNHNRYEQSFEYMFVFSKGKPKSINLIKDIRTKCAGKILKGARKHADGTRDNVPDFVCSEYKKRFNVWDISVESKTNGHPAVFPEKLANDHIISWSNENDIVLDPFMGSGTTGKMCKLLNRNFIGIEIDEKYFNIAKERIENAGGLS